MQTETIDKLFLELAQITTAKTPREMILYKAVSLLNSMVLSGEQHSEESLRIVADALSE